MHTHQEQFHIAIGLFVFGAIILSLAGIFLLYNQYLHGTVKSYVMFFQGSLNGLDSTSPITYRGVKIGQVERIELTANKAKSNVAIPVYVNFFIEKSLVQKDNPMEILIENGIVARVSSPNILTGKASIELTPGRARGHLLLGKFNGYLMFPTENITEEEGDGLANETLRTARKTLRDISRFINSKEFKDTIIAVKEMTDSVDRLARTLDHQVPGTLFYFNSSLKYFNDSLKQIFQAAYSTRNLTDYLARHPESLLRGRS